MVSDNLSAENSKLSAEFVVQLLQVLELNFVNYVANDCSSHVKEGVSKMKTLFLVGSLLPLLLPAATSKSTKHLLLETADKKNDSVVAGSDYESSLCYMIPDHPTCPKEVLEIPIVEPSRRQDKMCSGNSHHGAPCTT